MEKLEGGRLTGEQEVDFHALILSLARRWWVILTFALLCGALAAVYQFFYKDPAYLAQAVISIDTTFLLDKTDPLYIAQSDEVRAEVATQLGLTPDDRLYADMEEVTLTTPKGENNIILIAATSENSSFAVGLVNLWAQVAVDYINDQQEANIAEIEPALEDVQAAELALYTFLQTNGLGNLTWMELDAITGLGNVDTIFSTPLTFPPLTVNQRMELAMLMRDKNLAEWFYNQVSHAVLSNPIKSQYAAAVLISAIEPEEEGAMMKYLTIPLGLACGFFLAVALILLVDWWRNSKPQETGTKRIQSR